jgi:hypothetical protein
MIVRSQKEWDALPASFDQFTVIEIRSPAESWLSVSLIPTNAHVEAWESSHVEAWGSSHVEARGSSHVEAWESSHVEAWESSHVEARGSSSVHVQSEYPTIELFGFAVAIVLAKCKNILKKSRTCSVVRPKPKARRAIVFKRVSKDLQTQEKSPNQTDWKIGSTVEHPNWKPESGECGAGKFHACSRPYFCDQFRSIQGDRYVAIEVAVKDLFAWDGGNYPHKIGFRKGTVLHECDRYGSKLA